MLGLLRALLGLSIPTALVVGRARRSRAIDQALRELASPERREHALRELRARLGAPPMRMRDWVRWVDAVLHVAANMARVGLAREALALVNRIPAEPLDPHTNGVRAQLVAAACIALGERERARRELATVRRPMADVRIERAIVATTILLDALEGDPEAEARARDALQVDDDPMLRAALAHALAAGGRRDEAASELEKLRDAVQPEESALVPLVPVLERVARQRGPASALAEALLAGVGAPYRSF